MLDSDAEGPGFNSTAGFMTHITCRLTAKNLRSVIEYRLPLPFLDLLAKFKRRRTEE